MINYIEVDEKLWLPSSVYHTIQFKYPHFNPVQSAFVKHSTMDANFVVETATSSGKTVVAEIAIANAVFSDNKKAIYLAPLKALTQEKIDEWTEKSHAFSSKKLVIATGDYMTDSKRESIMKDACVADIVIMTTELFDSVTRRPEKMASLFADCGVIVVDESHLLAVPSRGSALESALMRFTQKSNAKIVFLSATMPNSDEIAGWLTRLNGKPTQLLKSDWRPVEIGHHFCDYEDSGGWENKRVRLLARVLDIVHAFRRDKFLIFVHSKRIGWQLFDYMSREGIKARFINADLSRDERHKLIADFKEPYGKGLDILITTSVVAWGNNLPARRVIIADMTRGSEDIPVFDIKQMAGRAGRFGIDDRGDVHYVLPKSKSFYHMERIKKPTPVTSRLLSIEELAFHLINEINEGYTTDEKLVQWFSRSLAAFAWDKDNLSGILDYITDVLTRLVKCGAVKIVQQDDNFLLEVTPIGKIASWFYYSPFMVSSLFYGLKYAGDVVNHNDLVLSWILGRAFNDIPASAPELDKFYNRLAYALQSYYTSGTIEPDSIGMPKKNNVALAYAFYLTINGKNDSVPPEVQSAVKMVQMDAERFGAMLQSLKQFYGNAGLSHVHATIIANRVKYGVGRELAELCSIPKIGAERAKKLFKAGFTSVAIIKNNIEQASRVAGVSISFDGSLSERKKRTGAKGTKQGRQKQGATDLFEGMAVA